VDNGFVSGDDIKALIQRFDFHLERIDQHMLRQEEQMRRQEEQMRRQEEHMLRQEERDEERMRQQQEWQEERMRRNERVIADNSRAMEALTNMLRGMAKHLDDMGDQIRANTQAVLSMLDRLDGPGKAA
jgi:CRISPR/Cas system-associated endonuclease/helicase Cas3